MKSIRTYIALLLIAAIAAGMAGCAVKAKAGNLMDGVSPHPVNGRPADDAFTRSMADFSIELFKKSITEKKNSLISPLSVMLALAMTANGADGETLRQLETLLGGGIRLGELNEYLHSYANGLPDMNKSKLKIANSIWFRDEKDRLRVEPDFLQKNANYYGAAAYGSAFDANTLKDINNWVKTNTDGMIDSILNEINETAVMYLINAVMFDAEWESVYHKENIREGIFTDITGALQFHDFMHSTEYWYLDDGMATGFIKSYVSGRYSFAALLPNEGVSIEAYIETLTGAGFLNTLNNMEQDTVYASMPKFEYEYAIKMNDALKALGIPDAFDADKADFRNMATSKDGNICIDQVLHKTFISVDELGTKAGAVTIVATGAGSSGPRDPKVVNLDRPFVFAIIDSATKLPVFIGTVMTV